MYLDGYSASANHMPLANLEPSPYFEKVIAASDGYGGRRRQVEPELRRFPILRFLNFTSRDRRPNPRRRCPVSFGSVQ